MSSNDMTASAEWRANWTLVLASMLAVTWVAAPTVSLSLFMEPLHKNLGWSYAEISSGLFLYSIISVFLVPLFGALVDRYGTRPVGLAGLALNGVAYACFGLTTPSLAIWWTLWVAYTLTQLMMGTYVWSGAISAAFTRSRGLAIGVVMGGIAVGQLVAPNVARVLIDAYGWRLAFATMGIGWTAIAVAFGLVFFHDPRAKAARLANEAGPGQESAPVIGGLTLGQALRDQRFLRIAFTMLLQAGMISGVTIHIVQILSASGISRVEATAMAGFVGVAALCGQVFTGWLADRVSAAILPTICFLLPALGYLLVLQGNGSVPMQWAGVLIAGYASGSAINITTYLTSRYCGVAHFGKIYGVISSCMRVGAGIGPLIAGAIVDRTHKYDGFLTLAIAAGVLAGLLLLRLGPYPRFAAVQPGDSVGMAARRPTP